MTPREEAEYFLKKETQFHLGFLPTEQSNALTATLEADCAIDPVRGIRTLQRPDRDVLNMAERVLMSKEFDALRTAMNDTIDRGGRIVFSGCGATGRLSILLESMWRTANPAGRADSVCSIMTGGDFALVKSVESFEDVAAFGARQVAELELGPRDLLVAITEGGETSSVLGSCGEALRRETGVFLLFNNPAGLLCERLTRSREILRDPRVTVLDLFCGPMALAGSTRMQATTSEQLIAGAALESVACRLLGIPVPDYADALESLLTQMESDDTVFTLARLVEFEAGVYRNGGRMTYFADRFLLDFFTDTTERSPTFMLPPFRKYDDLQSPRPWAFVKHPRLATRAAWNVLLGRDFLRCLTWTEADYAAMSAPEKLCAAPPAIGETEVLKFRIGNEKAPDRFLSPQDAALFVVCPGESAVFPEGLVPEGTTVRRLDWRAEGGDFSLFRGPLPGGWDTPLHLMERLAVKLSLNTLSTIVMTVLGRVSGNWMSFVSLSNKKLIDRGIRLVSELGSIPYEEACFLVFEERARATRNSDPGAEPVPVVRSVLARLKNRGKIAER